MGMRFNAYLLQFKPVEIHFPTTRKTEIQRIGSVRDRKGHLFPHLAAVFMKISAHSVEKSGAVDT